MREIFESLNETRETPKRWKKQERLANEYLKDGWRIYMDTDTTRFGELILWNDFKREKPKNGRVSRLGNYDRREIIYVTIHRGGKLYTDKPAYIGNPNYKDPVFTRSIPTALRDLPWQTK